MKSFILFLIALLCQSMNSSVLTGTVSIDNDVLAGCEVNLLGAKIGQLTDSDGKFRFQVDNREGKTLVISYQDGWTCKLAIEDIQFQSTEYDFGTIPLVYCKMIETTEYEKLNSSERKKYEVIRCWTQLLGYIDKTSVDTVALRTVLWTERGIRYRYDSLENKVFIKFKDWRK